MSLYLVLKLVHIAAAMVAVGANVSYAFWRRHAGLDRERLTHTLEGIHRLDMRVANPAYGVVLLAGLGMLATGPYALTTPWVLGAIGLYFLVTLIGISLYAPASRRQRAAALADPTSDAYASAARRSNLLGAVTLALVALIVVLMVLQPG